MIARKRKPALPLLIVLSLVFSNMLGLAADPAKANEAFLIFTPTDDNWMWGTSRMDGSDHVTGDGTYTIALMSVSDEDISFFTKESDFSPQLVVTYDAEPPDGPSLTILGHAVSFDDSGEFADPLEDTDHMFAFSGVALTNGSLRGPGGQVIYGSDDADIKAVAIEVSFDKWNLNYQEDEGLTVTEAVYDAGTGKFTDVRKVPLVRQIRPDKMSDRNNVKAVYVSGPITPGTRYLRISMPTDNYFRDPSAAHVFVLDEIKLYSADAENEPVDRIVDDMSSFAHFADGTDTSNLEIRDLSNNISDMRSFASRSYIRRLDAAAEQTIIYKAPEGKEFASAYIEGFYYFKPPRHFEVWTSADGDAYVNATAIGALLEPAFEHRDWVPYVLKIDSLPPGAKYVQVRLPAFTPEELEGFRHPHMTQISLGLAEAGSDPGNGTHPAETAITFTSESMRIDASVETDENGAPAGEWEGAGHIPILGTVDENQDEHSADIFLKYDYDNLYIGAKIKDPTPMVNNNTGANIWNGDNLEFFIGVEDLDFTQYPDKKMEMLPSDVQIVISGGLDHGLQYYLYQDGIVTYPEFPVSIKPDEDGKGYTIEASVPLKLLGIEEAWTGKAMLINPVLNDGGFAKRGQWGWTTSGESLKKSRSLWGLARFEPTSPPPIEITVNALADPVTKRVTVSGQTLNVQSKDVTIIVRDVNGRLAYIDQMPSDEQGHYAFTFTINGDVFGDGVYTVIAGGEGVGRPNTASFSYIVDTTPPGEVTEVTVTEADGKLTVTWTDPADEDFDHVIVTVEGQPIAPVKATKGVQMAVFTGLTNGTEYTLMIRAADAAGNLSQGVIATGTPKRSASGTPPVWIVSDDTLDESSEKGTVLVDLGSLEEKNGRLVIELSEEDNRLQIPADQLDLLEGRAVKVRTGQAVITIPAALMIAASKLDNAPGAFIVVQIGRGDELTRKPAGVPVTIAISLMGEDGEAAPLPIFEEKATIAFPVPDDGADMELLGIYRFDEAADELVYIGGEITGGGYIAAEIAEPGTYLVLEYKKTYRDVPPGHWAYRAIQVLTAKHIVSGVQEDLFLVNEPVTRADFAVMLANLLGMDSLGAEVPFKDVDRNDEYAGAVTALFEAGLIHGRGNGAFEPFALITREEMVTLIYRAYVWLMSGKQGLY